MKLYTKEGRLIGNRYELNGQEPVFNSHYPLLNKCVEYGFSSTSHRTRRQAWLDCEIEGKNYFKKPIVMRSKK